jgi:hypothetical protein
MRTDCSLDLFGFIAGGSAVASGWSIGSRPAAVPPAAAADRARSCDASSASGSTGSHATMKIWTTTISYAIAPSQLIL